MLSRHRPLVLASASPRRAELLRGAGVEFSVHAVDCDERWHLGERAPDYAARVAAAKAEQAIAELRASGSAAGPDAPLILAADTTVWLDAGGEPLQKPIDEVDARAMLRALTRGAAHRVTTACAFARADATPVLVERYTVTTVVRMRSFEDAEFEGFIGPYLDAGDWRYKAGAYAIQGRAAGLVAAIEGSYTGVVGLPLAEVLASLERLLPIP